MVREKKNKVYEFAVLESEVIDRVFFGRFEVIKTKKGILYKNFSGYKVFVEPYVLGLDGQAHETSLYKWLNDLIDIYKLYKGHEEENVSNEVEYKKGDLLEMSRITTEANLSYPLTAFIDIDYAAKLANEYINWMSKEMNLLKESISTPVKEEDVKANTEFNEKYSLAEDFKEMFKSTNEDTEKS